MDAYDPLTLYNQEKLRSDYLEDFTDLILDISQRNNYILNQILIWSIIHYVPLIQFNKGEIHVAFYESIYDNPQEEISKILEFTGKEAPSLSSNDISKPSRVVGHSIAQDKSPINSWQNELPKQTIDQGMEILEAFSLANLYNSNSMPNAFDLDEFSQRSLAIK